jgi:N-acetylglucosaminyldiphosphoundecaprenol N-acetyl-beta-D-mannosaminyltransferase
MKKVINKYERSANILGVTVTGTPKQELLRQIKKKLMKFDTPGTVRAPIKLTTPNPEHVLLSLKDKEFAKALNSSTYSLPDGFGLTVAVEYLGLKAPRFLPLRTVVSFLQGLWVGIGAIFTRKSVENELKTIKGRQFFLDLLRMANERKWRVFLLGGEGNVPETATRKLKEKFKKVNFLYNNGPMLKYSGEPVDSVNKKLEKEVIAIINKFRPHILFIAFGAPKQEKWMYRNVEKLDVGAVMVVGGTFDYIAGTVKLPPVIFSQKFEWLWRLVTQPKRLIRIFNASIVFPLKVFFYKINSN